MKQKYKQSGKSKRLSPVISFFFYLKRNHLWLRRLAFLWVFVIALEVSCPVIDCENSISELFSPPSSAENINQLDLKSENPFISQNKDTDKTTHLELSNHNLTVHCADECLCHSAAVINFNFALPKNYIDPDASITKSIGAPTISISPPFHPPKQA